MNWEFPDYPDDWDSTRKQVYSRAGNRCERCGSSGQLHAHHTVSLSKGGSNSLSNLECLCEDCHSNAHPHMKSRGKSSSIEPGSVIVSSKEKLEEIISEINEDLDIHGSPQLLNDEIAAAEGVIGNRNMKFFTLLILSALLFPIFFLLFSPMFEPDTEMTLCFTTAIIGLLFFIFLTITSSSEKDTGAARFPGCTTGAIDRALYDDLERNIHSIKFTWDRHDHRGVSSGGNYVEEKTLLYKNAIIAQDALVIINGKKIIICDISDSRLTLFWLLAHNFKCVIWIVGKNKTPLFKIDKTGSYKFTGSM